MEINLFEKFKEEFEMVSQFQNTFDPAVDSSESVIKFRKSLIVEEGATEFDEAMHLYDRIKLIDSVCDTLYVVLGSYVKIGLPFEALKEGEVGEFRHTLEFWLDKVNARIELFGLAKWKDAFAEVHGSNMSKACKTHEESLRTINQYLVSGVKTHYEIVNGIYVIYRTEDRKVMKSCNYSPAQLDKFI